MILHFLYPVRIHACIYLIINQCKLNSLFVLKWGKSDSQKHLRAPVQSRDELQNHAIFGTCLEFWKNGGGASR